jgi:ADP-ribose pyrophosphatase YjhB (NUDIX family)
MDLLALLEEVRVLARNGLHYTQDVYDRERYRRLLDLAAQAYGEELDLPVEDLRRQFLAEIGPVTPKVGGNAAIFNERGEILLMERADGSGWCLPCGWLEPNESPAETAVRETLEETGLQVRVQQLVDVFTRKAGARYGPFTTLSVVYLCEVIGGALRLSHEGRSLAYLEIDAVRGWHATHEAHARAARAAWQNRQRPPAGGAAREEHGSG